MSEPMVRKQIYLLRRQNLMLRRLARQRGVSEAEVIRQALDHEEELSTTRIPQGKQALNSIIAYARSLRNRSEFSQGNPYKLNREELYEERESRWSQRGQAE